MTLNKMLNETFQPHSVDDWKQKAEETLKGKPVDSLTKNTYENIKLKPLYTKEDMTFNEVSQYPGQSDYRRGASPFGYLTEEWKIAQKIDEEDGEAIRQKLLAAIEKGQSAISFNTDKIAADEIELIVDGFYTNYPFSIEAPQNQSQMLSSFYKLNNSEKISGYIAMDPIAAAVSSAGNGKSIEENYDQWHETILLADENMPELRTILIDTAVYHKGGANAVQELAVSLSTGVSHIQQLLDKSLTIEKILSKMVFKFSIGSNFFMEIAKLRAARLLWSKIAEAYGAEQENQKMVISADTSTFTKTSYDPYVNLLRAGNEAFAAVLGGIQFLHVSPFNEPEGKGSYFSERIARNTQLILREEAHLQKVADPAGGSWYVENLTNELAEKAWALFLQIEEMDGMAAVVKTGWIQEQIAEVLSKRRQDAFKRKQSIIGTNIYANISEKSLKSNLDNKTSSEISEIKPIPQVRLSEPFESLRRASEQLQATGKNPMVGLICLGQLKSHKARADFINGFLAPGGINTDKSPEIENPETALQFIKDTKYRHYFICGSNEQYEESVMSLIKHIKEDQPNVSLYLAGLPEESKQHNFSQAGIKQFIHIRSNCYETLSSLLKELEVAENGQ